MADTPAVGTPTAGKKRSRDDEEDEDVLDDGFRFEKKARPGSGDSGSWVPQDSVLNTPKSYTTVESRTVQKPKYDSDDQSSLMSEPGSPQDIAMSSGDEDMSDDIATFSQSNEETLTGPLPTSARWQTRMQANRVPTPILPPTLPGLRSMQVKTGAKQHIRGRHPQEFISISSDHLEVPSPIDEDEVPTPPSAAEAAGSQLSMLTVNDMDMESSETVDLPTISIDRSQTLRFDQHDVEQSIEMDSAIVDDFEPMDSTVDRGLVVRKQRQRSGALSSGHGSPSPMRAAMEPIAEGPARRGFSMGFRADCEKCRMRVPGHMNHFIT